MTNRFQPAFEAQREQFPSDATKTLEWRIDQLDRMERMRTDNKDAWCAALYQDFGKPPFEQLFEITVPTGVIKFYRDNLEALMTPQQRADPPAARPGHRRACGRQSGDPQAGQHHACDRGAVQQPRVAIFRAGECHGRHRRARGNWRAA